MTAQIKLVKGSSTLDLYGNTDKMKVVDWIPNVATQSPNGFYPDVAETITVKVNASSTDDLGSVQASIISKLEDARAYDENPIYVTPVWLLDRLENENAGSYVRRALVKRGTVAPLYPMHGHYVRTKNTLPQLQIGLIRSPFWEGSTACAYSSGSMTGAASGEDLAATVVVRGDVPARLSKIELLPGVSGVMMTTVWVGFKTDDVGGVAGQRNTFTPVWELEKGAPGSNASVGSLNATIAASFSPLGDGSGVYVDMTACAASAMVDRVTIEVSDTGATGVNSYAFRGDYLVLLRAYSSPSTTPGLNPRVRLLAGFDQASAWTTGQRVEILDSASLQFYEMGVFSIPDIRTSENIQNFAFRVEAERSQGFTGFLWLDCLCLVPVDRGFVKIDSAKISGVVDGTPAFTTRIYTEPNEEITGANIYDDGAVGNEKMSSPEISPLNWSLPSGCVRVIVAWQRDGKSVITDKLKITLNYFPRWKLMRGAE